MLLPWLERHDRVTDVALVLFVLATTVGATSHDHRGAAGTVAALLLAAPLLVRRRFPLPTLALATAATVAAVAALSVYNPFAVGIALFTVAARCPRRISLAAGAGTLAVLAVPLWSDV